MTNPIITIDGPSGSGKGTIAARLAQILNWQILDSGALYRALAYAVLQSQVPIADESAIETVFRHIKVQFIRGEQSISFKNKQINKELRSEACAAMASQLGAQAAVRQLLIPLQRELRQAPGLIADGRDMGTVIFPDAELKIFLLAEAKERAQRRYKQLKEQGITVKLADVENDLRSRDARDEQRAVAPLVPAADAVQIDTTTLTIDEVVAKVLALAKQKQLS